MRWMRLLAGLAVVAVVTAGRAAPSQPAETVVGSWRLVSAKANGKAIDVPAGTTILKHVTPTDFIFVYYDQKGLITVAGGGHYTLTGNGYVETVQYGIGEGMAPLIGKSQVFTLRIEGARWYHSGTESDGTTVEEVWERE